MVSSEILEAVSSIKKEEEAMKKRQKTSTLGNYSVVLKTAQ